MLTLVTANVELLDAALAGDDRLATLLGHAVVPGWATFAEALPRTRDALVADPAGGRGARACSWPATHPSWSAGAASRVHR